MLPLQALFRCAGCEAAPSSLRIPFCSLCLRALGDSPPRLCPNCAGLGCLEDACRRPWSATGAIDRSYAKYLLVGETYPLLRSWKRRRGSWLNRLVLTTPPSLLEQLRAHAPERVVPMPQRFDRAWRLGGSPAEAIARALGRELGIALWRPLSPPERGLRQSQLGHGERLAAQRAFGVELGEHLPQRILLVDDFRTTGRTLELAATALRREYRRQGAEPLILSYCLGIRPGLNHN